MERPTWLREVIDDPGLADDDGSCGQPIGHREETYEIVELVLPADEVPNADCHAVWCEDCTSGL